MESSGSAVPPNPADAALTVAQTPGATTPPSSPPKRRTSRGVKVGVAVAAVVVVAVLVLGLTGVIPFPLRISSGSVSLVPFSAAESAAHNLSSSTAGGPWTLRYATGMDVTTALSTKVGGSGCEYANGSGVDSIGSYSGNYSNGKLENWLFVYVNSIDSQFLEVTVSGGHASDIGVASENCGLGDAPPIGTHILDSTQVAAILLNDSPVRAFLYSEPSANAVYMLVNFEGSEGAVWEVAYQVCNTGVPNGPQGGDVEAWFNATSGMAEGLTYNSPGTSCSTQMGPVPINFVLSIGSSSPFTCPVGDTYATNGCTAGDYVYHLSVGYYESAVTLGSVRFEVTTATGGVVNLGTADGGFALLNPSGGVLAESTPSPLLAMTGWMFPSGSSATNSTDWYPATGGLSIAFGAISPFAQSYFLSGFGEGLYGGLLYGGLD